MLTTCLYAFHMPTMIQLRHVPDDLHRKLKARAALAGMSLSDYLLREIRDMAERPTVTELRARLEGRTSVRPTLSPARAVRAERDGR
jgi:plasmid stability protein